MTKKKWKPQPNHPWNVRARAQIVQAEKRKRARRAVDVDVFTELQEEAEVFFE